MADGVLTDRRRAVAEFVAAYRDEHGYGPDFGEILEGTGLGVYAVRDSLEWLRARAILTFLPWNDEHHWRSYDRGWRYTAVIEGGEDCGPKGRYSHLRPE